MAGRTLPPTSRFAADDGAADPALADALARRGAGQGALEDVVAALAHARVLVPVLAVEHEESDRAEHDRCAVDGDRTGGGDGAAAAGVGERSGRSFAQTRHASAGVVAVAAPDGRTALPVFSSVTALTAWHPTARPMPAEAPRAAAAALAEGWDLLVVDPGGETPVVVPRPAVQALALGHPWQPAVCNGAVRAEVAEAVCRAAQGPRVLAVDAAPGCSAEVAVVVTLEAGLSQAALERTLTDVGARLAGDVEVTAAVDSLELCPIGPPAAAPGDRRPASADLGGGAGAVAASGRGRRWRRGSGRR